MFKRFKSFRLSPEIRDNHAEVKLHTRDFIYPYFLVSGDARREAVTTIWGAYCFSLDMLLQDLEGTVALGIDKIWLKGIAAEEEKSKDALFAFKHNNMVELAVAQIKEKYPDLTVITDVDISAYTSHGQGGILRGLTIDNDRTNDVLAKQALSHARGGADYVSPSAMSDGQVAVIRELLDKRGFKHVKIMSFSARYASVYEVPEKGLDHLDALAPERRRVLVDYRTRKQGVEEIEADIAEGADVVGVKPAQSYLDIIANAKQKHVNTPLVAYQTAGECMSIIYAAEHGVLDHKQAMIESLTAIKRSGANYIISFFAKEMAQYLSGDPYYVI